MTKTSFGKRWRTRVGELFAKFDEGVESVLAVAIVWQAWRMWLLRYAEMPVIKHSPMNDAAAVITSGSQQFWFSAFSPPEIVTVLIILAIVSFIGLMEKIEWMRLTGSLFSSGWWLFAGMLLTIHSPLHDAGGLYLLFGVSGGLIYAHRFVMLDRVKTLSYIDWIVDTVMLINHRLYHIGMKHLRHM